MNNETQNQGSTSNPPAREAQRTIAGTSDNGKVTSGMSVQPNSEVRPISVKDVDATVITGSHKSGSDDVSAKFSTDTFKNQAGPRGETNDTELAGA
jgi:hypothetical protein